MSPRLLSVLAVWVAALAAAAGTVSAVSECGPNGVAAPNLVSVASLSFQAQMPSTKDVTYSNFSLSAGVPVEVPSTKLQPAAVASNVYVSGEPRFFSAITSATTRTLSFKLSRLSGIVVTPASWIPAELVGMLGARSFVLPSVTKQTDVFSLSTRPFTVAVETRTVSVGVQFHLFVSSARWDSGDFVRVRLSVNGAPARSAAFYRWTALQSMRGQWTLVTATVPRTGDGDSVLMSVFVDFAGTETSV
jgi:hypothetical protein